MFHAWVMMVSWSVAWSFAVSKQADQSSTVTKRVTVHLISPNSTYPEICCFFNVVFRAGY